MKRTIIATKSTESMFLIEFGSSYSSDAWDVLCVCDTEDSAEEYISKQLLEMPHHSRSLYHTTEIPVYRGN